MTGFLQAIGPPCLKSPLLLPIICLPVFSAGGRHCVNPEVVVVQNVLLNWQMSNFSGWGIVALNLFSQWAKRKDIRPIMGVPIDTQDAVMVDPLRMRHLVPRFSESNSYLKKLTTDQRGIVKLKGSVIDGLGNDLTGGAFAGQFNIGRCVFENTTAPQARERLSRYDALLCGSRWNAEILAQKTGRKAKVLFEGVDTSLFCPGPKSGITSADRFYVYSGGKVEHRKGQDLVLAAFRTFSQRHPDAVLVTAWHSLWANYSAGFRGCLERPVELDAHKRLDIQRWAADNGIAPDNFIDLGPVPNALMPAILRDMDVCIQPSRAEACTNLPVMEAMACGIPVILARNTGMLDLIEEGNCIALNQQTPIESPQTEGWCESSVEEIIDALEWTYQQREQAHEVGLNGSRWMTTNRRTWSDHAHDLLAWVSNPADADQRRMLNDEPVPMQAG
jgi:glycosyltransferase involved in cell wall biosynthesis